jgi:hypothetical protein
MPVPATAPAVVAPVVTTEAAAAAGPTAAAVHMAIAGSPGGGGGGGKPPPEPGATEPQKPIDYKKLDPGKLDKLARANDPDAALELASRQRGQAPFKSRYTSEEIADDIAEEQAKGGHTPGLDESDVLDQWGIREAAKPGGKPVPRDFELGNFAHDNAEALIPEDQLPRGLEKEVTIELKDGSELRMDRVNRAEGVVYEIKPDTPSQQALGELQVKRYVQYMNEQHPLGPGRSWQGRVVTYDRAGLLKCLLDWGYLK